MRLEAGVAMVRIILVVFLCGLLAAQTPQQPAQPAQAQTEAGEGQPIRVSVDNVVANVLVYRGDGNFVSGLLPDQFRLFDNGKEQNIHVDETFSPISLMILVQCNSRVEKILPD